MRMLKFLIRWFHIKLENLQLNRTWWKDSASSKLRERCDAIEIPLSIMKSWVGIFLWIFFPNQNGTARRNVLVPHNLAPSIDNHRLGLEKIRIFEFKHTRGIVLPIEKIIVIGTNDGRRKPWGKKRELNKPIIQNSPISIRNQGSDTGVRIYTFMTKMLNVGVVDERISDPRINPEINLSPRTKTLSSITEQVWDFTLDVSP